jgi:type I restriction enzyme S subunit
MTAYNLADVASIDFGTRVTRKRDAGTTYPVYGGGGETFKVDKTNRSNCLIVSRFAMSEQCVRHVDGDFFLNDSGLTVSTKTAILSQEYLDAVLLALSPVIYSLGRGTAQKNLDVEAFKKLPIEIPSMENQLAAVQKVRALNEEAQTLSDEIQKQSELTLELQSSLQSNLFQSIDESEVSYLSQLSKNLDSRRKPVTKNVRVSGQIPYYGASGIVDYVEDKLFDEKLLLVSEDGANLIARSTPIAFSIEGPSWVNNHAHVLAFESDVTQRYVEFYLNSLNLEPWITGAAQPKLNQAALNKIPIRIPSTVDEQKVVLSKLESYEAEIQDLQSKIDEKISLLAEFMAGTTASILGVTSNVVE